MATKNEARQLLSDVAPEKCFWACDGRIFKNMEELANGLQAMSDETFKYHANSEKNDFSVWASEVLGDSKLGNELLSSKARDSAARKAAARIDSLKKKAA